MAFSLIIHKSTYVPEKHSSNYKPKTIEENRNVVNVVRKHKRRKIKAFFEDNI